MVAYIDAEAERSLIDKIGGAPLAGLGNLPRNTVLKKLACTTRPHDSEASQRTPEKRSI